MGAYPAAEQLLRDVAPGDSARPVDPDLLAILAAARGDRVGVSRWLTAGDSIDRPPFYGGTPRSFLRAEVSALLGDRVEAVAWLNRAFVQGLRFHSALHWDAAFERLHGYQPFEALARSSDRR